MKIKKIFLEYKKEVFFVILFSFLVIFAFVLYSNMKILKNEDKIFTPSALADKEKVLEDRMTVAIFGAGMKSENRMTMHQKDRVIQGVRAYKKIPQVKQVLITGDDGIRNADEVSAMKELVLNMGVPKDDVLVDPHGYGTYESCYRADSVFGIKKMTAISQNFHLPRIIFTCSNLGVNTIGLGANLSNYNENWWNPNTREVLARAKAMWQVEFTRPHPANMWEVNFGF